MPLSSFNKPREDITPGRLGDIIDRLKEVSFQEQMPLIGRANGWAIEENERNEQITKKKDNEKWGKEETLLPVEANVIWFW